MPMLSRNDPNYHMGHLFMEWMISHPDAINQIDGATGETETNRSVLRRSIQLARCFKSLGLRPGDVLALGGMNHLDLHIPYYAALMNGLPIAAVDPMFKYEEIKTHFRISCPRVAFCQKINYEDYKQAAKVLGLDTYIFTFDGENCMRDIIEHNHCNASIDDFEPAIFDLDKVYVWLASSGGTTGVIKLSAYKHKVVLEAILVFLSESMKFYGVVESTESKIILNVSPIQWVSAHLNALLISLGNQIKLQTSAPPIPENIIDVINKYRPISVIIGPAQLTSILKCEKKCDLTCFRSIVIAGGKAPRDMLLEAKKRRGDPEVVFEGYGQTENIRSVLRPNPSGPIGNCGIKVPSLLSKLVDPETGREITEPNKPGELWTKTAGFTEYYNNPEATAAAFSEDGYYKTGDIMYRDEEDNYFFVERYKMMFKYRGITIIPQELEELIRTMPGVDDVSVVGLPNHDDGEWPVACVVVKNGAKVTANEIEELIRAKLSEDKQLRGGVIFMDDLPITSAGKLARGKLRQMVIDMKNKS